MPLWGSTMIKRYGSIALADIRAEKPEEWDFQEATHARVQMPAAPAHVIAMQEAGFLWADRTIKTSIVLGRCTADLDRMIRLPVIETCDFKDDIYRIACASFTYDRRFHIEPVCSAETASLVLRKWVDELDEVLVCQFRDIPVGFLALKQTAEDSLFIHLAAVEEKYRMTGAAMTLYATACKLAREHGFKKLEGRISSQNSAVMNVYAAFGASFSEPVDIFLKRLQHDA